MDNTKNLPIIPIGHKIYGNNNQIGDTFYLALNFYGTSEIDLHSTVKDFTSAIVAAIFAPKDGIPLSNDSTLESVSQYLIKQGKMSLYEYYKLRNFADIAVRADEILSQSQKKTSTTKKQTYNFDWIMRFFENAGNIKNETLQELWAKILTKEISEPHSCSIRTLSIMNNLSPSEAKTFNYLCKFTLNSCNDLYFIPSEGFYGNIPGSEIMKEYITENNMNYIDNILPLVECGLLTEGQTLTTDFKTDKILPLTNGTVLCITDATRLSEEILFSEDEYFLTKSGTEIFHAVINTSTFETDISYAISYFSYLKNKYPNLKITAHTGNINNGYDATDLLK